MNQKPAKHIGKGRRVLSEEEVYSLNKLHWEGGMGEHTLIEETGHGATVLMRYLVHTWAEYLHLKKKVENGREK